MTAAPTQGSLSYETRSIVAKAITARHDIDYRTALALVGEAQAVDALQFAWIVSVGQAPAALTDAIGSLKLNATHDGADRWPVSAWHDAITQLQAIRLNLKDTA